MEVSYDERRAMLYRDLERGDIVVGRINNIREYGFFLTLLCTAVGLKRDIEDLELSVGQQDKFILYTVKVMSQSLKHKNSLPWFTIVMSQISGYLDGYPGWAVYFFQIQMSVNYNVLFVRRSSYSCRHMSPLPPTHTHTLTSSKPATRWSDALLHWFSSMLFVKPFSV